MISLKTLSLFASIVIPRPCYFMNLPKTMISPCILSLSASMVPEPCYSMNLPKTACMISPLYSIPVCFYGPWTLLFHELTKDSLHDLPLYSVRLLLWSLEPAIPWTYQRQPAWSPLVFCLCLFGSRWTDPVVPWQQCGWSGSACPPRGSGSSGLGWRRRQRRPEQLKFRECFQPWMARGARGQEQCFGTESVLDPYLIRSVDPDSYSESGSGSRREKMAHKSRKKLKNFMGWSAGCLAESWRLLL